MSKKKIPRVKNILELSGILHEYSEGKPTDWDEIREETMRLFAEDYGRKMRRIEREHAADERNRNRYKEERDK